MLTLEVKNPKKCSLTSRMLSYVTVSVWQAVLFNYCWMTTKHFQIRHSVLLPLPKAILLLTLEHLVVVPGVLLLQMEDIISNWI